MLQTRLIVAAVALTLGASGCSSGDEAGSTAGAPTDVVFQTEAYSVADMDEVARLSDLVIAGEVIALEPGPIVGPDREQIGYMAVEVAVNRTYFGKSESTETVLITGYDPESGEPRRVEGTHWPSVGSRGIWFLHSTGLPGSGDAHFMSTSAGQLLQGSDGFVLSGGDQQAAAAVCGQSWDDLEALVIQAVSVRDAEEPPRAGIPSPKIRDDYAGNPCGAHTEAATEPAGIQDEGN